MNYTSYSICGKFLASFLWLWVFCCSNIGGTSVISKSGVKENYHNERKIWTYNEKQMYRNKMKCAYNATKVSADDHAFQWEVLNTVFSQQLCLFASNLGPDYKRVYYLVARRRVYGKWSWDDYTPWLLPWCSSLMYIIPLTKPTH